MILGPLLVYENRGRFYTKIIIRHIKIRGIHVWQVNFGS